MDPAELAAQRIADRGRGALLARLRAAFEETAAAHRELVELDTRQIDRLADDAVGRAGGALWRRALAEVAMTELDIPLAEAHDHPAVRRAQEMLGVPAYEPPLRRARPGPPAPAPAPAARPPEPAAPPPAAPPAAPPPVVPPPEPVAPPPKPVAPPPKPVAPPPKPPAPPPAVPPPESPPPAAPREIDAPAEPDVRPPVPDAIRVGAIHLEGIETLRPGARNIELRFSEAGMDVIDTHDGESIGRLAWDEIASLELPRPRRSLRRRRGAGPELMVMTDRGVARFELRGVSDEEAREHLAPVLLRVKRTGD